MNLPIPGREPQPPFEQPFDRPWQAHAFAMVVHLTEQGRLDWRDWAACLSAELHAADTASDGSDYYDHWVSALQKWLEREALAAPGAIEALAQAWQRAAHATAHGQPIELANDPRDRSRAPVLVPDRDRSRARRDNG